MSMTKKKDLVTQEEIDNFLNPVSNNNKSNQGQLLKLLQEMRVVIDGPTFEDSIDGTRIRIIYATEISRKGREGEQEGNTVRFQYIREIPIDYGKVPINFRSDANTITESYSLLEENNPTLHEILGLLKRIYFMPDYK